MIYLVTVNYYSTTFITRLIGSLPETLQTPYQLVIVNNSPDDTSIHKLYSGTVVIVDAATNLGFGRGCNLGLNWIYEQTPNAIVWLINPDSYLLGDALEKAVAFFQTHPQVSIAGTVIYSPSGNIWFAGGRFISQTGAILTQNLLADQSEKAYILSDWVSGCSLLINLRNFETCPQFDPAYFLYYEDFDFCRRYLNQGHSVVIIPKIGVVHEISAITNQNIFSKYQQSTYSYLLTLEKYANKLVLFVRLIRLILHALVLLMVKPTIAFAKLDGIFLYFQRRIQLCPPRF